VIAAGYVVLELALSDRYGFQQDELHFSWPVGFQNSATSHDPGFYAARSYSLMRPPRTGRRLIHFWERSATG
jgi:hypothetical protein